MAWVKYTCGRLKSDFRYSKDIVYNNYPFAQNISETNKKKVEEAAQTVLDTRQKYPNSSLADLYDPLSMPPDLVKAHQALDKAVDLCYRAQAFVSELARIEYLFNLYEEYDAPSAIAELSNLHAAVYPSPTASVLNIDFTSKSNDVMNISIYDITGKLVFNQSSASNIGDNYAKLDVSSFNQGLYIVELKQGNSVSRVKFAKL